MAFLLTIVLALIAGGIFSICVGENPIQIFQWLVEGSLGSWTNLGYTLFYSTPFIFTGLAVAIPYRVQLFNIGAEGQFLASGIFLYLATLCLPMNLGAVSIGILILAAAIGGAIWAGLAGWFKAWRGSHEVITTIMLNFIASGLLSYLVLYLWKDPASQLGETPHLPRNLWIGRLGMGDSPLNFTFILAVVAVFATWFFLEKTNLGFKLRAAGANPNATRTAGIHVSWAVVASMLIGGALASGVAVNEILGTSHRLRDGFCEGYGFIGIAVAFLGRGNPFGVLLSALFFGALYKGSTELEMETDRMTRDFSMVMQGIFIAAVGFEPLFRHLLGRLKKKRKLSASSEAAEPKGEARAA